MTIEILLVLSVLGATLGIISQRWLSVDVALMAALGVVTVGGVLEPSEAVAGFASTAVVAIGSLYILTAAAGRVGLLDEALRPWGVPQAGSGGDAAPDTRHVVAVAAFICGLVALPIAGILPFETVALFGAVGVVVSGVLSPSEARNAVDWKIIIAVGAVLGLARAVAASGAMSAASVWILAFGPALQILAAGLVAAAVGWVCASRPPRRLVASGVPLAFAMVLHFAGGVVL